MLCIGLFGTCGESKWRNSFIEKYISLNIPFFNPQVKDWAPELAEIEADHLVNDEIILFPVTKETFGTGSLSETGFSILQAINSNYNRSVVIMIDKDLDENLITLNPIAAKESIRARALVSAHIAKINKPNVYVVDSLETMLLVSIKLYEVHKTINIIKNLTLK